MRHEIGPIIQEDKDPRKILRALARGCGGVIVDTPVPEAVTREFEACVAAGGVPVKQMEDAPPTIIVDETASGHARWSYEQEGLAETHRWLMDEFQWAAQSGLCRKPEQDFGKKNMLRLWLNNGQYLPWHFDRGFVEIYPDIHKHIGGRGLKVAAPDKPLNLTFSENRTSPHLLIPGTPVNLREQPSEKEIARRLKAYLQEAGISILKLQPGQTLFFNQKCLHSSAAHGSTRLRAGIF